MLNKDVLDFLKKEEKNTLDLLEKLAKIPAPSGKEDLRAEFVKKWLIDNGAEGAYIDDAKNVVLPIGCENGKDVIVFMAHTDVVFPDTTPLPFRKDEEYFYCPGVGDDTACLVIMLTVIKFVLKNKRISPYGIVFVANSCEEGLGNLKGVKEIMRVFGKKVKALYTFDGSYTHLVNKCVGSHRYEISFETEGGHSFSSFGNRNAIAAMSNVISELYQIKVPEKDGAKTTYNVGVVNGGTSVNTIAQKATMLFEYRSDDRDCLEKMKELFKKVIEKAKGNKIADISVKLLGDRPCGGDVNEKTLNEMTDQVIEVCEKYSGVPCKTDSGSTDANIPMSLGVPALCVGTQLSWGAHTREEKLLIKSIPVGLKITADIILKYFE